MPQLGAWDWQHGPVVQGNGAGTTTAWFDNIAEFGWIMQIFCDWEVLTDGAPKLREIARDMRVIGDHCGMVEAARSVNEPNFRRC
jgi:predicted TIM-barrel fold metal-dependent hydrolase